MQCCPTVDCHLGILALNLGFTGPDGSYCRLAGISFLMFSVSGDHLSIKLPLMMRGYEMDVKTFIIQTSVFFSISILYVHY